MRRWALVECNWQTKMVPVPIAYARLTGNGPASYHSLRGRGRQTDRVSHSTALSGPYWQISSEGWSKASEEHNTKAAALRIRPGVTVSLCHCTATQLHRLFRDNEDTVALQNRNVVHRESRPALLTHNNTERDSTTICTKPCCYLLVALWMFLQNWAAIPT